MKSQAKVTRVSSALDLDLTAVVEETARLVLGSVNDVVAPALAQIQQQVRGSVNDVVVPALAQIQQQVSAMTALLTAPALGPEQTVAVLASYLPTGSSMGGEIVRDALAQTQAERLLAYGYALVPLHGAALEHTVQAIVPAPASSGWRDEATGLVSGGLVTDDAPRLPVLPTADQVRNLTAEQAATLTASMNQVPGPAHLYAADEVVSFVSSLKDGASNVPGVNVEAYEATARADARLAEANRDPQDSWRED